MKKLIVLLLTISSFAYSQTMPNIWVPTSGSANTYSTYVPAFGSSYNNKVAFVKFNVANTSTSTISINGLGAAPIRKWDGSAYVVLSSGDIKIDRDYRISYDNINSWFRLEVISTGGGGSLTDGSATTANGTAVDLGGTLAGTVNIDGNEAFNLGGTTPLSEFNTTVANSDFSRILEYQQTPTRFYWNYVASDNAKKSYQIFGDNIEFGNVDLSSGESVKMIVDAQSGAKIIDTRSTPKGLTTAATGYVTNPRSYADKEYVDSKAAKAGEGTHISGDSIHLGGDVYKDVLIKSHDKNFLLGVSNTPNYLKGVKLFATNPLPAYYGSSVSNLYDSLIVSPDLSYGVAIKTGYRYDDGGGGISNIIGNYYYGTGLDLNTTATDSVSGVTDVGSITISPYDAIVLSKQSDNALYSHSNVLTINSIGIELSAHVNTTNGGKISLKEDGSYIRSPVSLSSSGIWPTSPSALVIIGPGSTTLAPLRFVSAPLMTTPVIGSEEFLTDKKYLTILTGTARKEFALNDASLTSGRMPFVTTNGRLKDDASLTYSTSTGLSTSKNITANTVGSGFLVKEGTNGRMGQTTLVAGIQTISVASATTSTRCFVQLVTAANTTLTVNYQCACTAGTVTLRANVAAGTINTADVSTLNYMLFEPAP